MNTFTPGKLTRFAPGSFKEIAYISLPLMLTAMSGNLMWFLDRLVLARYSLESMNAAATAGIVCALFQFGMLGITAISEVFVGQFNGAGEYKKTSIPVWQMIWFSLASYVLFVPLALWGGPLLVASCYCDIGIPYFKWVMFFGPMIPLIAALSGFFIGLGKVRLVTFATIISNLLNLGLDILLVFGIEGILEPMGAKGAAIATGVSQLIQALILFLAFQSTRNRNAYDTNKPTLNFKMMEECLKVGVPSSLGHMIEMAAWAFLMNMTVWFGNDYITVFAFGQSVFVLFCFFSEGLSKGLTAVSSNFIGAGQHKMISKSMKASTSLLMVFMAFMAIPLVLFPEVFTKMFITEKELVNFSPQLMHWSSIALFWVWLFCLLDGLIWVIAGVFTAAGDTKFIMIANTINSWFVAIFPIYLIMKYAPVDPPYVWALSGLYSVVNLTCFIIRYKSNKWMKLDVTTDKHVQDSVSNV